jgi:hypothetical protein
MKVEMSSAKRGERLVLEHRVAHDLVVRAVLHATGAHDGVVEVDLGDAAGAELVLELEDFGLEAVTVGGGGEVLRDAELEARLLDVDGVSRVVPDAVDVVEVAVLGRHERVHGPLVPVDLPRGLLEGVLDDVVDGHLEELVEAGHVRSFPVGEVRVFGEPCVSP